MAEKKPLRINTQYGDVVVEGEIASVKCTSDRDLWVRWEGKTPRYCRTGRKIEKGFTRQDKELWLVRYRSLIIERFYEEGLSDSDIERLAQAFIANEQSLSEHHSSSDTSPSSGDEGVVEDKKTGRGGDKIQW